MSTTAAATPVAMVGGLYAYHWWANRRLFEIATVLGEEVAGRDLGPQWSFPTLRRMLGHVYGADWIWLARWQGRSPGRLPGDEFGNLASLRTAWDALERQQRAFVETLDADALGRMVEWTNTSGAAFRLALWPLLLHVANHATHHRSELATMVTLVSGSPPDTGIVTYALAQAGQGDMGRRWA